MRKVYAKVFRKRNRYTAYSSEGAWVVSLLLRADDRALVEFLSEKLLEQLFEFVSV